MSTITTIIKNFRLPLTFDIQEAYFDILKLSLSPPSGSLPLSSNSPAPFSFFSSNINILTINNNIGIINGIGTVTITVKQNAFGNYTAASLSTTINIISYTNNSINTDKIFFKVSGKEITNYNPFTNILNTDEQWHYFKYIPTFSQYSSFTSSSHTLSSQILLNDDNSTIKDYFTYKLKPNSDVFILYSGSGSPNLSTTINSNIVYCGGGPGEVALTKINSSDINDNTTINITFSKPPTTSSSTLNGNTIINYVNTNSISKSYTVFGGRVGTITNSNGIGGNGGSYFRAGSYQDGYTDTSKIPVTYFGYNGDTLSFGSGSGSGFGVTGYSGIYTTNNNGTLNKNTPNNTINYGTTIDFSNSIILSDNTGTSTIQYGGTNNNSNISQLGFVLIFYKVIPQYSKIISNSGILYNKLTNATQIYNIYNYNPFNKIIKVSGDWVYNLVSNGFDTSYIFNLINNNQLLDQNNLNLLFNTISKTYIINGNINILYIGGGGNGGIVDSTNLYSGGGGGSSGCVKHILQQLNLTNTYHNFEIKIGSIGNPTSCIYNTNNNITNYGDAIQGNDGNSPLSINVAGNGGNGIDNNILNNILGASAGGGGDGNTNGNNGIPGLNTFYYPFNNNKSNSGIILNLNDNAGNIIPRWSGFGGAIGKNGEPGDPGLVLFYYQVIAIN
jgi:hypothetical protein